MTVIPTITRTYLLRSPWKTNNGGGDVMLYCYIEAFYIEFTSRLYMHRSCKLPQSSEILQQILTDLSVSIASQFKSLKNRNWLRLIFYTDYRNLMQALTRQFVGWSNGLFDRQKPSQREETRKSYCRTILIQWSNASHHPLAFPVASDCLKTYSPDYQRTRRLF